MKQITLFLILFLCGQLYAQDSIPQPAKKYQRIRGHFSILELDLLDLPYNYYASALQQNAVMNPAGVGNEFSLAKIPGSPGMEQSTQLTNDMVVCRTYLSYRLFRPYNYKSRFQRNMKRTGQYSFLLLLELSGLFPFGPGWQHEEFHRAAMTVNNCYSHNTISPFGVLFTKDKEKVKSVNQVLDTNLVLLKKNSNPELVRIHATGCEANIFSAQQLQEKAFEDTSMMVSPSVVIRYLTASAYLFTASSRDQVSAITHEMNEVTSDYGELQRDFTGIDLTAWAYDLFNPALPYSARGYTANGTGYDRYIYDDKLTGSQYNWILKQAFLSVANFVSPLNFTHRNFHTRFSFIRDFNFGLSYYPSSFGSQTGCNFYWKSNRNSYKFSFGVNSNYATSFPFIAISAKKISVAEKIFLSPAFSCWIQPENASFFTRRGIAGALVDLRLDYQFFKNAAVYFSFRYKSQGWVFADPFLKSYTGVKMGLSYSIPQPVRKGKAVH